MWVHPPLLVIVNDYDLTDHDGARSTDLGRTGDAAAAAV